MFDFDIDKSLQELDGHDWTRPALDSGLALRCTSLRQKPLREFTAGDLRVMIGQQLSLRFLIPVAMNFLLEIPFVQGDLYPGDLFVSVLSVDKSWWNSCDAWLVEQLTSVIGAVEDDLHMFKTLISEFRNGKDDKPS